jgi:hypothetical protein
MVRSVRDIVSALLVMAVLGGRVLVYWSVAGALGRRRARSRHRIMDLADRFLAYRLHDALRVRAGHGRLTARPAEEH